MNVNSGSKTLSDGTVDHLSPPTESCSLGLSAKVWLTTSYIYQGRRPINLKTTENSCQNLCIKMTTASFKDIALERGIFPTMDQCTKSLVDLSVITQSFLLFLLFKEQSPNCYFQAASHTLFTDMATNEFQLFPKITSTLKKRKGFATTENILKSVMLALMAISYEGVQNILSNSRMEWQLEQMYSTASQSVAFKKDKIYLDAQVLNACLKKKISPIIFNLSVYATFHCPISSSVRRATGF